MSRSFKIVAIAACATLALAGCGKRGALEPPTAVDKTASVQPKPKEKPHRDFVLDGLLR